MHRLSCTLLLLWLLAPGLHAQSLTGFDESPLLDLIEIDVLGHDLVAFGATGGEVRERLHLGEQLRWSGSRGALGVVITDQRVLAVSTRSASWQERRYERGEMPPLAAQLGDRVALVTTGRRALGFNAASANLFDYRLGPNEVLRASSVGEQVGVVVTSRSALGLSPVRDGFQAEDLQIQEQLEAVDARSSLATVRTSRRMLVFRGATGAWGERRLPIHER